MSAFEPTTFDKAVSRVLIYLKNERKLLYSQFADETGLAPQTISAVIALSRGVPLHRVNMVKYILRERYKVNDQFLETNKGPFLSDPLPVKVEEVPQYADLQKNSESLAQKIKDLEDQLNHYKQLVQSQSALIESLQETIKSSQKSAR